MSKESDHSPLAVGRRIRIIRQSAEPPLSQSGLAKRVGVEPSTVGNWEQGRSRPAEDHLSRISAEFNVTADYILFGKTGTLMHGVASSLAAAERRISNN